MQAKPRDLQSLSEQSPRYSRLASRSVTADASRCAEHEGRDHECPHFAQRQFRVLVIKIEVNCGGLAETSFKLVPPTVNDLADRVSCERRGVLRYPALGAIGIVGLRMEEGTMGQWIRAKVREWYILGIGLIFVVGGLSAASFNYHHSQPSSTGSKGATTAVQSQQGAVSDTPAPSPKPAAPTPVVPAPHNHAVAEKSVAVVQNPTAAHAPAVAPPAVAQNVPAVPQNPPAVAQSTGQAANPSASAPALAADAAAGRLVYRKCQACHSLAPGKNGLGPSLAGIVGQKAAASPALTTRPP